MLLCIYPKELKICPHKNLHTDVYRTFIHNCQNLEATNMSFSRGMDKLWYIQTMECYLALKRNELSSYEKTWRKLKCIFLSKRSQSEKATYCMIPTIWYSVKGKTMETMKRSSVARNGGGGKETEHRRVLGQWKYSVWYYNDILLYVVMHLSKLIELECITQWTLK